jgi:hypothetical protein
MMGYRVAYEDQARIVRDVQPFVAVYSHRIGKLYACEESAAVR